MVKECRSRTAAVSISHVKGGPDGGNEWSNVISGWPEVI